MYTGCLLIKEAFVASCYAFRRDGSSMSERVVGEDDSEQKVDGGLQLDIHRSESSFPAGAPRGRIGPRSVHRPQILLRITFMERAQVAGG
jgi:hypothetical protein